VVRLIDLTDLDDAHRPDGIDALVADAVQHRTAAVCVWPEFVAPVRARLDATGAPAGLRVATVVNFPDATSSTTDVLAETRSSLDAGADEIDMVLPYGALIDGDEKAALDTVIQVAQTVHERSCGVKVIIESGVLADADLIRAATRLAITGGADFVKTSTGKTSVSATLAAVDAVLDEIVAADRVVGLKPSGGIRTVDDAAAYLDLVDRRLGPAWATPETFRFGASGLLADAVAMMNLS